MNTTREAGRKALYDSGPVSTVVERQLDDALDAMTDPTLGLDRLITVRDIIRHLDAQLIEGDPFRGGYFDSAVNELRRVYGGAS